MEDPAATDAGRLERLLRDAHIQRMRQQWAAAEALCREALELAPEDPMGLEMLGELLVEKGATDEALVVFRKGLALQPEKAVLEEKIARAVLVKSEEERERVEAQLLLSNPRSKGHAARSAAAALLLSIIFPGAGHFFLGLTRRGAFLAAVWVLFLFSGAAEELFKLVLAFSGGLPAGERVNDLLASFGIVGILAWVYGVVDVSAAASRSRKRLGE